jgi:hypothetical protein
LPVEIFLFDKNILQDIENISFNIGVFIGKYVLIAKEKEFIPLVLSSCNYASVL